MKKYFKNSRSASFPRTGTDVTAMIDKIQRQLAALEKKVDDLAKHSPENPFERKRTPKAFGRFDRPDRYNKNRKKNNSRETGFTKVVCAACKKECEIPFKPSGGKPVYCRKCFSKHGRK